MRATKDRSAYFATCTVPRRVESVRAAAAFIVQASQSLKVPGALDTRFELAVVEALTNAVKHAKSGRAKEDSIVCEIERRARIFCVRILDAGPGFTLPPVTRPGVSRANIASLSESGYGVGVIQAVFPRVRAVRRSGRFGLELPVEL